MFTKTCIVVLLTYLDNSVSYSYVSLFHKITPKFPRASRAAPSRSILASLAADILPGSAEDILCYSDYTTT